MKIVRTKRYSRDIKKLGASAADIDRMESSIASTPELGAIIQGLKGVRKARFRIGKRGKSGGGRVIYYVIVGDAVIVMLTAYSKTEKDDLTPDDRKAIGKALEELEI